MAEKRYPRANLTPDAYEGWQWLAREQWSNSTALIESMGLLFAKWRAEGAIPGEVLALDDFQEATDRARDIAVGRLRRNPTRGATPPRGVPHAG